MQRLFLLFLVGLFLVPVAADAATGKFMCPTAHFVRFGATELRETTYAFLNGSVIDTVTIERLTIRNAFGVVVHDSGPAIGVPHPLNDDFSPPEDFTVIAPRRGFYIKTKNIWGLFSIPGGNEQGFFGSAVVEFSAATQAAVKSFRVIAMRRIRQRLPKPDGGVRQGEERVATRVYCFSIKE